LDFSVNGFLNLFKIKLFIRKVRESGKIGIGEGKVRIGQTLAIVRSEQITSDLNTAEAAYQNALADYNRFENAYSTGGVTKQQLDQTKLNLVTSKSRLQQAKVNVGDTNIKSTINGN
jgi:multidrug resistance efflux pump